MSEQNRAEPTFEAAQIAIWEAEEIARQEGELVALCAALIDGRQPLSPAERHLARAFEASKPSRRKLAAVRAAVRAGADPLGELFSSIRDSSNRRQLGAIYTPAPIVHSMVRWLATQPGPPARIVDPGAGSGRFILAAGERFPKAQLVAIEMDPLAALMLRANLSARRWTQRAQVFVQDYRKFQLPAIDGWTAYCGNPPYVRHHGIDDHWK